MDDLHIARNEQTIQLIEVIKTRDEYTGTPSTRRKDVMTLRSKHTITKGEHPVTRTEHAITR